MHAGIRTAKAAKPISEVINHAHTVNGMRESVTLVRISRVVGMKLRDPSNWPMQKIAIDAAQGLVLSLVPVRLLLQKR